ncbi:hypothetical protein NDK47_14650 [Brevibacillus ruminantium]|uniref:Uncharacterized protein n=1 Tax=Brevibacillus ruminantium TaxID=2950604 RepID=A0ABY4W8B0_9BACL|nr:hypothetical protein [Brevibacillus ruminantium]USG63417.1 hypothetical protein NDK47_14650 [Brevibacillus ruminantium]
MKTQMWTFSILCLAVIFHLLTMSGWVVSSLTQPLQLATLMLMLTAITLLRKKKRKRKRASRTRKPAAEVNQLLERAEGGDSAR